MKTFLLGAIDVWRVVAFRQLSWQHRPEYLGNIRFYFGTLFGILTVGAFILYGFVQLIAQIGGLLK